MIKSDERLDRINGSLQLLQKKSGLTFGTDAYLLYAYLKKRPNAVIADLGAGTGVISLLALSGEKAKHAYTVEVQSVFSELIGRNAAINSLSAAVTVIEKDVRELTVKDLLCEVDTVVMNPPYMTENAGFRNRHDEKYIARHEVLGGIYDFCRAASRIVKFGGSVYVVFRADRSVDLFCAMRQSGIEPKRLTLIYADAESAPALLLCEGKKGASGGLYVTKPLLLKDKDGRESEELTRIYQNGGFDECYEFA